VSTLAAAVVQLLRQRRALRAARHQARHDPLTGLANRRGLRAYLHAAPRDRPVALALLDLDRFKAVNDRYGHAAGDEVLVEVARRLAAMPPPVSLAARLSGDEFVLVIDADPATAHTVAAGAAAAIAAAPVALDRRRTAWVSASVGLAASHASVDPWSLLLPAADRALYHAKTTGQASTGRRRRHVRGRDRRRVRPR